MLSKKNSIPSKVVEDLYTELSAEIVEVLLQREFQYFRTSSSMYKKIQEDHK